MKDEPGGGPGAGAGPWAPTILKDSGGLGRRTRLMVTGTQPDGAPAVNIPMNETIDPDNPDVYGL